MNLSIGKISQRLTPGFGWCYRCFTTWAFVDYHTTQVTSRSGMFPLCEKCWAELTPNERVPFYRRLFNAWGTGSPHEWKEIEQAVLLEQHDA